MKLFRSLLVAPAALGLLAPLSATASETNLNEISNYSDIESIDFANSFNNEDLSENNLVAGGEGLVDVHSHDGSFSETTTASFSADFMLGAIDNEATADVGDTGNGGQSVMGAYSFQIDLNTSFTGEDSLDVSIDAGNAGSAGVVEFDGNATSSDSLVVDGVSYTFPIGAKTTAFVGDNTDGSLLFDTACVYGGPSNTLDDCGNNYSALNAGGGSAFGASYDVGNGFTAAFGYTGSPTGLMTEEGDDAYATQVTYSGDNYGVSFTYAYKENPTFTQVVTDSDIYGLNAYFIPSGEGLPSISAGYETANSDIPELSTTSNIDSSSWFVGLSWDELGPGSAGIAVGTKQHTVDFDSTSVDDELLMYEAYYSYEINDGMTVTPLIYTKEFASGTEDESGVMVKTSFSF
ncbi:MAG: porin [Prochlorococcus marinus CUG1439]|uniref:porin n=1 Tax=Prochlorococcus sp. MIT 1314 TaxID=3096220 RepID=UPI001B0C7907|nr:porin [Prochlorococcus sp. MIT 1314]MCR8540478.1 porin [Prochlorococcus marinus CUG1439]